MVDYIDDTVYFGNKKPNQELLAAGELQKIFEGIPAEQLWYPRNYTH
jgi:hypothetical protein